MTTEDTRIKALAQHLNIEPDEDEDLDDYVESTYGSNTFEAEGGEYLVLTDDEADEATSEQILDSLWAFNASFLVSELGLPIEAEDMIKGFQEAKCEDSNDTILAMLKDKESFVEAAVSADGRGHFLSGYDGEEYDVTVKDDNGRDVELYIYRTN